MNIPLYELIENAKGTVVPSTDVGVCPKANVDAWDHSEPREPHVCPFRSEIADDFETLCGCCSVCEHECGLDI